MKVISIKSANEVSTKEDEKNLIKIRKNISKTNGITEEEAGEYIANLQAEYVNTFEKLISHEHEIFSSSDLPGHLVLSMLFNLGLNNLSNCVYNKQFFEDKETIKDVDEKLVEYTEDLFRKSPEVKEIMIKALKNTKGEGDD